MLDCEQLFSAYPDTAVLEHLSPRNDEGVSGNSIVPYALVNHSMNETSEHLRSQLIWSLFHTLATSSVAYRSLRGATIRVRRNLSSVHLVFYEHYPHRVVERVPSISEAVHTAKVIIGGFSCDHTWRSVRFSNLLKGAAAQAMQNMNLMYGLPLDMGLHAIARSTKSLY